MECPNCRVENPSGFRFCGACGKPLTGGASEPERRQLTLMFCDLVGSTALSQSLDPEELHELMLAYQQVSSDVISRFEGHIAQYLGDGLLVYFGYPMAHEDDAQRAVRAGLEIVGAIHELPLRNTGLQSPIQVRIGIHTGVVVVGEMGGGQRSERLALGDTPNIASRVQSLAEPNTVLISSATHRLVQGHFECNDMGTYVLKGVSSPMRVYRVIGESRAMGRFDWGVSMGLTPLVGREREVEALAGLWEEVKRGEGRVVLLSGEPGIGKSRLLHALRQRVSKEAHVWLRCRCLSYYQNSALHPVIDLIERALDLKREDSSEEKFSKLEKAVVGAQHAVPLQETIPLFGSLLSLPLPYSYAPLNLTPQKQKEKTLEALLGWLIKISVHEPVLFVTEDVHWIDPSSLELLSLLIDYKPAPRILVLVTFRPDFNPPWIGRPHITNITLNRLNRREVEVMVESVTGNKALPPDVVEQIVSKTDGVPLFVEELTKMVIESGLLTEGEGGYELTSPLPTLAVPATLQDSLMARLDRLATVKEVAQMGATLGREFTYELLSAVSLLDEETLKRDLSRLVESELLYQSGIGTQTRYLFKHALIRDAAYQSLLKSKRQKYHQRIAQVLEDKFPETVQTQPELLAYHYTEGGFKEKAILYWQRAGQRAIERSANIEAIAHLTKGLELLKSMPDTPERTQKELVLQMTLAAPLVMTKGHAAPEVEKAYTRAQELCHQAGETPQLFMALWGLWRFYVVRAEFQIARELAEQLFSAAKSMEDPVLLLQAHRVMGVTYFFIGEQASARVCLERAISLYDPQKPYFSLYGDDPGVVCLSYESWVLWLLGYPDQALMRIEEAISLARRLSQPFSLAYALDFAAVLHHFRREEKLTKERAEEVISLSTEQGFALYVAHGTMLRGWALAEEGRRDEGIAEMHRGWAIWRATGAGVGQPYYLARLAELYGNLGHVEKGLAILSEALAIEQKSGDCACEAELYRLKGELLLIQAGRGGSSTASDNIDFLSEAEACFHKSMEIARNQGTRSWELRAAMSLGRLWEGQGRKEEARRIVAGVHGWFTEGFDTKDLREANALLEELL
jgi:class 3 adenylate cyclase/predicted ATPase